MLQNGLIALDTVLKQITKTQAKIRQNYEGKLKKKVYTGEFEYSDHVISPVMKKPSRSVAEDTQKRYYKPLFDDIIEVKTAILEKTCKISIKDVELFMGSLAEKVIKQGGEVIGYEIQVRKWQ